MVGVISMDGSMKSKRYIIVCFSLNKKKSLLYRDCGNIDDLAQALRTCVEERSADIVSIRKYIPDK